jgi:hypothetical protein
MALRELCAGTLAPLLQDRPVRAQTERGGIDLLASMRCPQVQLVVNARRDVPLSEPIVHSGRLNAAQVSDSLRASECPDD